MSDVNEVKTEPVLEVTVHEVAEMSESPAINYEPSLAQTRDERFHLLEHYDIFLSHGSGSNDGKVLLGEKEFVGKLVEILKGERFSKTVFVDYIDNIPKNIHVMRVALAKSSYGVLICSPRYLERYLVSNSEPIPEEADYFMNREARGQICSLPILFKITEEELYNSLSGFSGKFRIDSEYGSPKLTLDQIAENTAKKIIERIESLTPHTT